MVSQPFTFDIREFDVVMPLAPMCHVNAGEIPGIAPISGTRRVSPASNPGDRVGCARNADRKPPDVKPTGRTYFVWLGGLRVSQ
jgi:hypothetical protein